MAEEHANIEWGNSNESRPDFGTVKRIEISMFDIGDAGGIRLRLTTAEGGVVDVAMANENAMVLLALLDLIRQRRGLSVPSVSETTHKK